MLFAINYSLNYVRSLRLSFSPYLHIYRPSLLNERNMKRLSQFLEMLGELSFQPLNASDKQFLFKEKSPKLKLRIFHLEILPLFWVQLLLYQFVCNHSDVYVLLINSD